MPATMPSPDEVAAAFGASGGSSQPGTSSAPAPVQSTPNPSDIPDTPDTPDTPPMPSPDDVAKAFATSGAKPVSGLSDPSVGAKSTSSIVNYIRQRTGTPAPPGEDCGTGIEAMLGMPLGKGGIQGLRTNPKNQVQPDSSGHVPDGTGVWFGGDTPGERHYGVTFTAGDGNQYLAEVRNSGPGTGYKFDSTRKVDFVANERTHAGKPIVYFKLPNTGINANTASSVSGDTPVPSPEEVAQAFATGKEPSTRAPAQRVPQIPGTSVNNFLQKDLANAGMTPYASINLLGTAPANNMPPVQVPPGGQGIGAPKPQYGMRATPQKSLLNKIQSWENTVTDQADAVISGNPILGPVAGVLGPLENPIAAVTGKPYIGRQGWNALESQLATAAFGPNASARHQDAADHYKFIADNAKTPEERNQNLAWAAEEQKLANDIAYGAAHAAGGMVPFGGPLVRAAYGHGVDPDELSQNVAMMLPAMMLHESAMTREGSMAADRAAYGKSGDMFDSLNQRISDTDRPTRTTAKNPAAQTFVAPSMDEINAEFGIGKTAPHEDIVSAMNRHAAEAQPEPAVNPVEPDILLAMDQHLATEQKPADTDIMSAMNQHISEPYHFTWVDKQGNTRSVGGPALPPTETAKALAPATDIPSRTSPSPQATETPQAEIAPAISTSPAEATAPEPARPVAPPLTEWKPIGNDTYAAPGGFHVSAQEGGGYEVFGPQGKIGGDFKSPGEAIQAASEPDKRPIATEPAPAPVPRGETTPGREAAEPTPKNASAPVEQTAQPEKQPTQQQVLPEPDRTSASVSPETEAEQTSTGKKKKTKLLDSINPDKISDADLIPYYEQRAAEVGKREPLTRQEARDQSRALGLTPEALVRMPVGWKPSEAHFGLWAKAVRDTDAAVGKMRRRADTTYKLDPTDANKAELDRLTELHRGTMERRAKLARESGQSLNLHRDMDNPWTAAKEGDLFRPEPKGKTRTSKRMSPGERVQQPNFGKANTRYTEAKANEALANIQRRFERASSEDLKDCGA